MEGPHDAAPKLELNAELVAKVAWTSGRTTYNTLGQTCRRLQRSSIELDAPFITIPAKVALNRM